MDLIRPIVATWVRSSSHSPRLRNRLARYSTSGRCSSTSSPRMRSRSWSPSGSSDSRSNSSLACPRSRTACWTLIARRAAGGGSLASRLAVAGSTSAGVTEVEHGSPAAAVRVIAGRPAAGSAVIVSNSSVKATSASPVTPTSRSRLLRRRSSSRSPGPAWASTLPASAESTVHANVSPAGARGARQGTDTEMVISSRPSAKLHSRLLPGSPG